MSAWRWASPPSQATELAGNKPPLCQCVPADAAGAAVAGAWTSLGATAGAGAYATDAGAVHATGGAGGAGGAGAGACATGAGAGAVQATAGAAADASAGARAGAGGSVGGRRGRPRRPGVVAGGEGSEARAALERAARRDELVDVHTARAGEAPQIVVGDGDPAAFVGRELAAGQPGRAGDLGAREALRAPHLADQAALVLRGRGRGTARFEGLGHAGRIGRFLARLKGRMQAGAQAGPGERTR